jgi:hypothetical protein
MKKNQNKEMQGKDILGKLLEGTSLADAKEMDVAVSDSVCVIHKGKMTVLELTEVIDTLSNLASDLTVVLAQACGFCDNCGQERDACDADCEDKECSEVCAFLNGCKDSPADGVMHCELCQGLLDGSGDVHVPDYILEEAGIPTDAKLEAYADEDSGEITVVEADIQQDITDVPPGIVAILAKSGVCLAELDELIMLEEIVYGK